MSNAIDMSLDDLIKKNKQSKSSKGRGGARKSSSSAAPGGPTRRNFKRRGNRRAPYSTTAKVQARVGSWPAGASIETGTKLYISNLHYGVSTEDIKELFSIAGELKRYNVHYDRSGRSKETADVVFARRSDALAAIKKYNNVQLDGKPMKIEIGTNISSLAAAPASVSVNKKSSTGGRSRGKGRERARHSGRGARRGGGRDKGGHAGEKVSAEDLDAELDKYHTEAMQTN